MKGGSREISYSYGKWTKHHILMEDERLAVYLPETRIFSQHGFWELMDRYGAVVLKPSKGAQGYGVIHFTKDEEDRYHIHNNNSRFICDAKTVEEFLNKEKYRSRIYIVQEAIPLATLKGCPFDIRVMVKRDKETGEWREAGMLVKVAARGYRITNVASDIITLDKALLGAGMDTINQEELVEELNRISIEAARQLAAYYTNAAVFGLDIGITNTGKIYIIEANLNPNRALFNKLKE